MRINELFEAKFRKPVTMFHGTSTYFLRNILKNGMIPFPKKKTWDVDPHASETVSSRASIGGSYWTSNLLTATSSAYRTTQKFSGNELIVIANIQQQSAFMDEDDVVFETKQVMADTMRDVLNVSPDAYHIAANILYDDPEKTAEMQNYFIKKFHSYMTDNIKTPIPTNILKKHFENYFIRIFSHLVSKENNIYSVFRYTDNPPDNLPSIPEAENNYHKSLDYVTKYYRKNAIERKNAFSHTLRITEPVTFSGANKITHIIEISDNLILHYGNPKNIPDKFISEYTSKKGELPDIVDTSGKVITPSKKQ